MKKLLTMVIAATMLVACGNDDNGGTNKPNNGGSDSNYTAPITIDGNFADWDALDQSKVSVATLPEGEVQYGALYTLKVYADELFVFAYIEFDDAALPDKSQVPMHFYLNSDNDSTTGGGDAIWTDADADFLFEGFVYQEGSLCSYDPGVYSWHGLDGDTTWDWGTEDEIVLESGRGLSSGAGSVDGNGLGRYEFAFLIDMMPFTLADTFSIGAGIQQNWNSVGMLPCGVVSDLDLEGTAEKLVVTIDK